MLCNRSWKEYDGKIKSHRMHQKNYEVSCQRNKFKNMKMMAQFYFVIPVTAFLILIMEM